MVCDTKGSLQNDDTVESPSLANPTGVGLCEPDSVASGLTEGRLQKVVTFGLARPTTEVVTSGLTEDRLQKGVMIA